MNRRRFLRLGSLGSLGLGLEAAPTAASCIVLWQRGGMSHLDTFDMKPDAPADVRGEFREIPTNVPGIRICEHLPRTARIMDKLTIIRSMCSSETNHERAGWKLAGMPPALHAADAEAALHMIERGARFVSLSTGQADYDTHSDNFGRLKNYLLPAFDRAFSKLITGLDSRGMLSSTLVVALTEFGRTPRINALGGRDHHSRAWSVVLAGAGLPGGRVLGATDRTGTEVTDLPVSPEDLLATIYAVLRIRPEGKLAAGRVIEPVLG